MAIPLKDITHIRIMKQRLAQIKKACSKTSQTYSGWLDIAIREKIKRDHPEILKEKSTIKKP